MLGSNTLRSIGLFAFLALSLTLGGCSSNSADTDRGANTAAKSEGVLSNVFETAKPVTIPEGTAIHIVLDQSLTSNRSHAGDDFEASISEPVVVAGKTVIPKGARVGPAGSDFRRALKFPRSPVPALRPCPFPFLHRILAAMT